MPSLAISAALTCALTEFNKLWIHGLTHLFGYDHKKDLDFLKMNKIEKKFISYLN